VTPAHNKGHIHCICGALKEAYLSVFVLFFRKTYGWSSAPASKALSGVLGVALVENFLLLGIFFGFQIETGRRIELPRWVVGIVLTVPLILNYYFLGVRRHGILFEKEFDTFDKVKRITLLSVAVAIMLAIVVMLFFIGITYRHIFLGL
jgi:hypothetical protein